MNYQTANRLSEQHDRLSEELDTLSKVRFYSDEEFIANWQRQEEIHEELDSLQDEYAQVYEDLTAEPVVGNWHSRVIVVCAVALVCLLVYTVLS